MKRFHSGLPRRRFLKAALSGVAWSLASPPRVLPGAEDREGRGLTSYQIGPQIWVRWNNRLLTSYRAHPTQKYPYLFPIAGPLTGVSLTAESSLPWPHHRSVFFGCDRVNGGNYWQDEFAQGQIVSSGPKLVRAGGEKVEIADACEWRRPDGPVVMRDARRITLAVSSPQLYWIDFEIEWKAVQDVTVSKTNHSLFAVRASPDLTPDGGGELLNAEGARREKGTFGKPSAWCAFVGRRDGIGGAQVEGIALMDHPRNPWPDAPWFTRNYGFMSPTPFNFMEKPWKLGSGQSVTLRYRVVPHGGRPEDVGLDALHKQWAAGNK